MMRRSQPHRYAMYRGSFSITSSGRSCHCGMATPPPTPESHPGPVAPASGPKGRTNIEDRDLSETRKLSRLRGKGPTIVLAEERLVSEQLLEHPESFRQLVQSGLLFTVLNGTLAEIAETQGGWTKVVITEGHMRGRSGWLSSKQVQSRK